MTSSDFRTQTLQQIAELKEKLVRAGCKTSNNSNHMQGNADWYAWLPSEGDRPQLVFNVYRWDMYANCGYHRKASVEVDFHLEDVIETPGVSFRGLLYGFDAIQYDPELLEKLKAIATAIGLAARTWGAKS
jgi:hypothetical protein